MSTFKDVFSYESIEHHEDFPDRDSDTYVNCIMLKTISKLHEGQHVPFICVSLEFITDDQSEYLYDNEFVKPFPFVYRVSYDVNQGEFEHIASLSTTQSRRTERTTQCLPVVYYDCEMLQTVGSFEAGEEYPYIIVVTSLFAFDEEGNLCI